MKGRGIDGGEGRWREVMEGGRRGEGVMEGGGRGQGLEESDGAVLYPPQDNPYGIHGMGGGFQQFQMESMEWGMDSILF